MRESSEIPYVSDDDLAELAHGDFESMAAVIDRLGITRTELIRELAAEALSHRLAM